MQTASKYIALVIITLIAIVLYRWTTPTKFVVDPTAVELLDQEVQTLEADVERLEQLTSVEQDELTKERTIRNQLFMQKNEEIVLEVPPEFNQIPKKTQVTQTPSPWSEWKKILF